MKYLFVIVLALFTFSCTNDPKLRFAKKMQVAVCQENQGMVTYEVFLYSDSTFYQDGNAAVEYSYGDYHLSNVGIEFKTNGGTRNLCENYLFDSSKQKLIPINNCDGDFLNFLKR